MRTIQDIDRKDLELLLTYKNKKVLCIKSENKVYDWVGLSRVILNIVKGEYYNIDAIHFTMPSSGGNGMGGIYEDLETLYSLPNYKKYKPRINCANNTFKCYDNFFEYFELRTLQDIRKDKIKSILK